MAGPVENNKSNRSATCWKITCKSKHDQKAKGRRIATEEADEEGCASRRRPGVLPTEAAALRHGDCSDLQLFVRLNINNWVQSDANLMYALFVNV